MFPIFGDEQRTERAPGGLTVTRERSECDACGTTFVTDELRAKQGTNDPSDTVV